MIDILIEKGFNATYGARPLKRAIEQLVVLPLARFLASRERPGADLLRLQRQQDQIVLSAASLAQAERRSEVVLSDTSAALASGAKKLRLDDKKLAQVFAEIRRKLQDWEESEAVLEMRNERNECLAQTNAPTFWDDGEAARETLGRFYFLDRLLKRVQQLLDRAEYLEELAGLVHRQRDARYRAELASSYEQLHRDYAFLNIELLCAHIKENHRAILLLRPLGTAMKNSESQPWITMLASIYAQWSFKKGYEVEGFQLVYIPEAERTDPRMQFYPYRWQNLNSNDLPMLLGHLETMNDVAELAFALNGTNVYGFLKGESGLHRRNERRPGGERVQQLVEVTVVGPGRVACSEWLENVIASRMHNQEVRASMSKKELVGLPATPEAEIVRVYQFEGERLARDLRTQVKMTDMGALLEGRLDDFILAYLQDEEVKMAWEDG